MCLFRFLTFVVIVQAWAEVEVQNLPSFNPNHYNILLQIHENATNSESQSIPGRVIITGMKLDNSSMIILNAENLQIDSSSVTVRKMKENGTGFELLPTGVISQNETLSKIFIPLEDSTGVGDMLEIKLEYKAGLRLPNCSKEDKGGFISFGQDRANLAIFGLGHNHNSKSSISRARTLFPCWDEPGFKAKYSLTIIRPFHYTAVFLTPLVQSSTDLFNGNWTVDLFEETKLIPVQNFIVVVIPSEVPYANGTFGDEKYLRVFDISGDKVNESNIATFAARIMAFYDNYFNSSGVNVKEQNLFYIPFISEAHRNMNVRFGGISIHESQEQEEKYLLSKTLSDSWLGYYQNLGCIDDIKKYLNNYLFKSHPTFFHRGRFRIHNTRMMTQLERFLTFETVQKGLNSFISLTHGGSYSVFQLAESMQLAANQDNRRTGSDPNFIQKMILTLCQPQDEIIDSFSIVILDQANSTHVTVSQDRIGKDNTTALEPFVVKIISGEGQVFGVLLEQSGLPKTIEYPESSSWLLVDKDENLPYIVYKPSLLSKLDAQLRRNHSVFSVIQRHWLLQDYKSLVAFGHASTIGTLNLTRYMDQERVLKLWESVRPFSVHSLVQLPQLMSHPEYFHLENFFGKKLDSALNALLKNYTEGNSTLAKLQGILKPQPETTLLKFVLQEAFENNSTLALNMGKNAWQEWKVQGRPKLAEKAVIQAMARAAGDDEFEGVYDLERSNNSEYKFNMMYTLLQNVNDEKLFKRLLEECMKDPFMLPIFGLTMSSEKRKILFAVLDKNIDSIPREDLTRIVNSFEYATQEQVDEMIGFINHHSTKFNDKETMQIYITEKAQDFEIFMQKFGKEVLEWGKNEESL